MLRATGEFCKFCRKFLFAISVISAVKNCDNRQAERLPYNSARRGDPSRFDPFLLSWVTLQLVHPFWSLFFCLPQSGVIPDSLEPAQIAAKKTQLTGSSLVTAVIGFYC